LLPRLFSKATTAATSSSTDRWLARLLFDFRGIHSPDQKPADDNGARLDQALSLIENARFFD